MSESEWPKPWKRIMYENSGHGVSSFKRDWVEFSGGVRGYKDTLYVAKNAGKADDELLDAWMPFDMYISEKVKEA